MNVIWVVGLPNGGTSCVAGILHHLGVNMGEVATVPTTRKYLTYEDPMFGAYGERNFRAYLQMRLAQPGPVGVKCLVRSWVEDPEPETLPVRVVMVTRPLEDCMQSSLRLWTEDRRALLDRQLSPIKFLAGRIAGIAQLWTYKEMLRSVIEPELEVEFYDVLERPCELVALINYQLELEASADQIEAAIQHVDAGGRHV